MPNALTLLLTAAAGCALGLFFFAGLAWTIRKGVGAKQPALWFAASGLTRTIVAVVGFYLAGAGHWQRLVACLFGFVIARFVVTRFTAEMRNPRLRFVR